ncbi:50S ribosomal protein L21 [Patescibacteria group bacterium]|nr:50S ribosomal protein L21 [Patescibacteria group bacterium]
MKIAVIETGGKQYKIIVGQKLKVEKLDQEIGTEFVFDKVLLLSEDDKVEVGCPYLKNTKVKVMIIKNKKDTKKIVFKYHAKSRYRKKKGHRQQITEVEILDIK